MLWIILVGHLQDTSFLAWPECAVVHGVSGHLSSHIASLEPEKTELLVRSGLQAVIDGSCWAERVAGRLAGY